MPLIRAMRGWFGRRMAVNETYYPSGRLEHTGTGSQATQLTWMLIVLIALPLIATLILIGLFYEVILRLDRSRGLGNRLRWAVSGALGVLVAVGLTTVFRNWLLTASLAP